MKNNKVVLYIAMSLDGYIAKSNGSVDWLFDVEGDGEDNGYNHFYSTVGTIVMGRLTYDEVLQLADDFPYANKTCYVLSRSKQAPAPHVIFTDEDINALIPRLKNESDGDVWLVGGGQLVAAFLEANLLDELQIAVIPKVLGEGIPLFPKGTLPSAFRLTQIQQFGQIVSLSYTAKAD
ncbi:dihydrofolate reductase family protein [Cohnella abietis]|uniref:Diacylglycerol kinase n=1 Tax=Cohnella abietis TaxID=2507935 RepID=A0A3T1DE55_9BACL|nr:dihydrofolate reductase family protein [Cohnella abietis]BBI36441.1 diacylglycerol kinase [Cohnella abietis]